MKSARKASWLRKTLLGGSLAATAVLVAQFGAQPAQAASQISVCYEGYFCAWSGDGATGAGVGWYGDDWNWGDPSRQSFVRAMNNNSESWYSAGTGSFSDVQVYDKAGGSGASGCVPQNTFREVIGLDNAASAHVWRNSC